jgi:hypothetical protein
LRVDLLCEVVEQLRGADPDQRPTTKAAAAASVRIGMMDARRSTDLSQRIVI